MYEGRKYSESVQLVYNHRINAILGSYNSGVRRHPELHHYQTETIQVLPSLISISYLFWSPSFSTALYCFRLFRLVNMLYTWSSVVQTTNHQEFMKVVARGTKSTLQISPLGIKMSVWSNWHRIISIEREQIFLVHPTSPTWKSSSSPHAPQYTVTPCQGWLHAFVYTVR